jgi:AbiV family abortive infection protein
MTVTPQYLLRGSALALEQCGLLLRDAVCLYQNRSFASAVVLAAFAREELGRYGILRDFRRDLLDGSPVTIEQIKQACDNHVTKQREGMVSSTLSWDRDSRIEKLTLVRRTHHPHTQEWEDAEAEMNEIMKRKDRRTPNDRHELREKALYVEPKASGVDWNRPADMSAMEAHNFLRDAVNDYSGPFNNLDVRELLDPLAECPEFPRPVWPEWPR